MSTERTPLWEKLRAARRSNISAMALLLLEELAELDPVRAAAVLREAVRINRDAERS